MVIPKPQLSLRNAREYFREHLAVGDYYAEGQKVTGQWFGLGAEKLGLADAVKERDFLRLCEGQHPVTGERLTPRLNASRRTTDGRNVANRRVFFDLTISPPKSVSIVALMQDDRILALHDRVVRQTMAELEKFAETRVRKSGQNGEHVTGNLITACFRHDTSRELDPQLHTHCVVLNATFDTAENRWKALHPAGLYRAQSFATNFYRHELARGLRSLGYDLDHRDRGFEIKGIPASLITRFSKRHAQIDAETERRLRREGPSANPKDVREWIAHDSRQRKRKNSTADRLRPHWRQQLNANERTALAALLPAKRHPAGPVDVAGIVAWADEHLFERRSVVREHELLAAALARGRGGNFDLVDLREAADARGYVREAGSDRLTSREVLGCELEIVVAAHDGRHRHSPLAPNHRSSSALSAEQKTATEKILGSRDFITLFRGGAGTGKSFTLKEVERGLVAAGRPVIVLAPQRQQVQGLQAEGLSAQTLKSFIDQGTMPPGAIVMVDEAGQVGGRQLRDLVRITQANAGRLILSGDTRQHGAVAASDALVAIEKHSGLTPAVLRQIRRQDPKLGATARERGFIRHYRAAVRAAAKGWIVESFDRLDRLGCIREFGSGERRENLAMEYLAAVARKEKPLVVAQTREEVRTVNEAIRKEMSAAGRIGAGAVVTACGPLDLGEAQKRDPRFYQTGQCVCFFRSYGRFAKGDLCSVVEANERKLVLMKDGRQSALSFRYADRFVVAAPVSLELARGDRLQLKFNGESMEGRRLANGELVTVRRVRRDGAVVVVGDDGARKTLAPSQRLFVRGYAVTSYGSQGKTVDTVLFADAANRAATNAKQWYVTISRGRKRVVVFTSDKESLRANVESAGERELALEMKTEGAAGADVTWGAWQRRALDTAERYRRHQAVTARSESHRQQQRIAV